MVIQKEDISLPLPELTKAVRERRPKIPISHLLTKMKKWVRKADPFEWAEFKAAVMATYSLTEEKFKKKFTPPTLTIDGYYPDDIRLWIDKSTFAGFCRRYTDYHKNTESPASYHLFCSIAILGAALRRQVWFDQRIFKVWPAVQVLLLGPSGQTAKSTSGNCAIRLVEETQRTKRIANRITLEALYQGLGEETARSGSASGILYAPEMSTLFTKNESYNQGLIQVLTDLYDCPDQVDNVTKTSGSDHIRQVALSFIGGSNEGWASFLDEQAMMGGFMGRHLVAYQEGAVRSVPFPGEGNREEYVLLQQMLLLTRFIKGEFVLNPESTEWYKAKYEWIKTHYPNDRRSHGFWSRYAVHLIRLGMLFRAGEMVECALGTDDAILTMAREIEVRHLSWADEILAWSASKLPSIYFALGTNKMGEGVSKIIQFIVQEGGKASDAAVTRAMMRQLGPRQIRENLNTLVSTGVLSETKESLPIDGSVMYELMMGLEEL